MKLKPSFKVKGILRKKIKKIKKVEQYPQFNIKEPRFLIVLPSFSDRIKVDVKYPLLEPYVYTHIKWVPEEKKLIYSVIEPPLSEKEKKQLSKIEENLTELIDVKMSVIRKREEAIKYLQGKVKKILLDTGITLPPGRYVKFMYYIVRDFVGLNEIEAMMHDPYIEDIGCTGVNTPVYLIHRRYGSLKTNLIYKDADHLGNFVIKLSERCGRYISYAVPLLDGSLPDGSRVQASLAKDVTTKGPTFSIRKFRKNPFSPIDLMNFQTVSSEMMAYLWLLLQYNVSILICGGVATGKTTFLNSLSMFIPPEDKIVSIEDTREINIPHENWIPSVARTGFGVPEPGGKRYGEITLFDLLRESFRQNPDYVIVGEVRGKEAYVMFQGMASGHPSLGTIHAGSVDDVIKRLETPPIDLSPSLIEALDLLIVMVNAKEKGESARRVKEVVEIQSLDVRTGRARIIKTFTWVPAIDKFKDNINESEILRRLSFEKGLTYSKVMQGFNTRKNILEWMQRHGITQFDEVSELINLYHKDPSTIMEWVDKDLPPYKTLAKKGVRKIWESATGIREMK